MRLKRNVILFSFCCSHLDCAESLIFPLDRRDRALCVTGGHLDECQNFLGGLGGSEKNRETSCPHITAARVQRAPVTEISQVLSLIN